MTKRKIPGFDSADVLAPLVVGITGHRVLREEDRPALEEKVREILTELRKNYPDTPLILISALAEGADRLAAKVALSPHVKARLIVPLPMPIDQYEQDFKGASLEEFRTLLDQADAHFELHAPGEIPTVRIPKEGPDRDRRYELVGKFIAEQCQILIALWDGRDSGKTGGTSSVVHSQLEGVLFGDPYSLEDPEGFPVYHVLTPRPDNPYPQGQVLKCRVIYPKVFGGNEVRAKNYYSNMFARLNEFNRYVAHPGRALASEIRKSKSNLLNPAANEELPAEMAPALNRYAVADALAIRFQRSLFRVQVLLHVGIFSAFLCFLLFADGQSHWLGFLCGSFGLVCALLALRHWSGKRILDTRHEDYRAMAEGLRVKFFWKRVRINDSIIDHYLGKHRSELDWIRNGFRGWNVSDRTEDPVELHSLEVEEQRNRLAFVRKHWIDQQREYFLRAGKRNHESEEHFERFGLISMLAVVALGLGLIYGAVRHGGAHREEMVIALEAFLAIAALLHHFNNRMGYAEYAKQYERMASLFAHGSHRLGQFLAQNDYQKAQRVVVRIGHEALTENGDWVLLRRERPLEIPHP